MADQARAGGYAARLNAFKVGLPKDAGLREVVARAGQVPGLDEVDLNFPDHLEGLGAGDVPAMLEEAALRLNGFAMRYYSDPAFRLGALTHPDPAVRQKAIDLTRRGIDALAEAGGATMTLWLGQDGFDYPFQGDHSALWAMEVEGIAEIAAHNPAIDIAIEYKPNEPRAFSLIGDIGTTLLAIRDAGAPNLGVTLDFAHVLYANEQPAFAVALAARHSRLLGVHLNDGYAKRDDGLMVGAVNTMTTLEFLHALETVGYGGVIYFDTFPDATGLDPVAECARNIRTVEGMRRAVRRLKGDNAFAAAMAAQDAVAAIGTVQDLLFSGSD